MLCALDWKGTDIPQTIDWFIKIGPLDTWTESNQKTIIEYEIKSYIMYTNQILIMVVQMNNLE